jgi:hypothetical protein
MRPESANRQKVRLHLRALRGATPRTMKSERKRANAEIDGIL